MAAPPRAAFLEQLGAPAPRAARAAAALPAPRQRRSAEVNGAAEPWRAGLLPLLVGRAVAARSLPRVEMPEVEYSVDAAVFAGVPNYRRIVLLAEGCSNPGANAALESDLRREIKQLEDDKVDITNPKIACWWDAYKAVGIKGEKSKVQPGVSAHLFRHASTLAFVGSAASHVP